MSGKPISLTNPSAQSGCNIQHYTFPNDIKDNTKIFSKLKPTAKKKLPTFFSPLPVSQFPLTPSCKQEADDTNNFQTTKKGRGRPRKSPVVKTNDKSLEEHNSMESNQSSTSSPEIKTNRGRKIKINNTGDIYVPSDISEYASTLESSASECSFDSTSQNPRRSRRLSFVDANIINCEINADKN